MKSVFIFALLLLGCQTARANPCDQPIQLSKVDNYVLLQGHLCPGDGKKFIQYMAGAGKGVTLVRLNSGGVQRIYSHANYIQTGKNPKQQFGLGYHHPNVNGDFLAAVDWYQKGIVPYLKDMLPPKAFAWVYKTDQDNMTPSLVWLNGAQALELGIATSTQAPRSFSSMSMIRTKTEDK